MKLPEVISSVSFNNHQEDGASFGWDGFELSPEGAQDLKETSIYKAALTRTLDHLVSTICDHSLDVFCFVK